jgi:hypothetical protein
MAENTIAKAEDLPAKTVDQRRHGGLVARQASADQLANFVRQLLTLGSVASLPQ